MIIKMDNRNWVVALVAKQKVDERDCEFVIGDTSLQVVKWVRGGKNCVGNGEIIIDWVDFWYDKNWPTRFSIIRYVRQQRRRRSSVVGLKFWAEEKRSKVYYKYIGNTKE